MCLNSRRPVSDFLDEKAVQGLKQIHQQVSVQPLGRPSSRSPGTWGLPAPKRSPEGQSWGCGANPWGELGLFCVAKCPPLDIAQHPPLI